MCIVPIRSCTSVFCARRTVWHGIFTQEAVYQRSVHFRSPSGDKSAQYGELLDKHKQANDELLKGANVSDLYNKENTTATSAANTKAGGDPKLGGEGASAPHDK